MKLALGTVQFGMDYGRFNRQGCVPRDEVSRILALALAHGVDTLDTAQAYGDSERVLGGFDAGLEFKIVSKILIRPGDGPDEVRAAVEASCSRLRVDRLHGMLVHNARELAAEQRSMALRTLNALRRKGTIERSGVSVYDAAAARAWAESEPISLVQLPLNVLDQRALGDGSLAALHRRGIAIHVRSAFLQGLLLQDTQELAPAFAAARGSLARFQRDAFEAGSTRAAAALGFVLSLAEVERVVIGVQSASELEQAIAVERQQSLPELDWSSYALSGDTSVIDPSTWPGASAP